MHMLEINRYVQFKSRSCTANTYIQNKSIKYHHNALLTYKVVSEVNYNDGGRQDEHFGLIYRKIRQFLKFMKQNAFLH